MSHVFINLTDFDGVPPDAAGGLYKKAARYRDLVSFGSLIPSGQPRQVPIPCSKRPNRRLCRGLLVVRRRDLPAAIEWHCPVCDFGGEITGFSGRDADLSDMAGPKSGEGQRNVDLPIDVYTALRETMRSDDEWRLVIFGATVVDERSRLSLSAVECMRLASALMLGSLEEESDTRAGRIANAAESIVGAIGEEFLSEIEADPRIGLEVLNDPAITQMMTLVDDSSSAGFMEQELFGDPAAGRQQPRIRAGGSGGRRSRRASARTYQIKVTLRHIKPPVWRRLLVPGDIELEDLHLVLQAAMGWYNCHLYAFRVGDQSYSPRSSEFDAIGMDTSDVELRDVAPKKGSRLVYDYDFGDGWEHDIVVEQVVDEASDTVQCIKGKRACPPEDCGGPWGYARMCEAIADPTDEEHGQYVEWHGEDFDPEEFDLEDVQETMAGFDRG